MVFRKKSPHASMPSAEGLSATSPQGGSERQVKYVGFQDRVFAAMVDMMLSMVVIIPFIRVEYPPEVTKVINDMQSGHITPEEANSTILAYFVNGPAMQNAGSGLILELIISGIVVVFFWLYRGATPGKMVFNMKIVTADTLEKPSLAKFIIRYFGYIVSSIPLFLGFAWIAVDKRKQGWHDKLAGTVVIYQDGRPAKTFIIVIGGILLLSFLLLFIR